MSTSSLQSEIKSAFADAGLRKVDKATMSKCVAAASALQLTAQQVATCWEAFSINKQLNTLNEHSFASFRNALAKESDAVVVTANTKGAVVTKRPLPHVTPPAKRLQSESSGRSGGALGTPTNLVGASPAAVVANRVTYGQRKGVGQVVASYKPQNTELPAPAVATAASSNPRCTVDFEQFDSNVKNSYRRMFTTLDERAKALDEHMTKVGQVMVERYNLGGRDEEGSGEIAPLEGVGVPRQDKVCCIGRICNAAHEGRINATSVLLEGSRGTAGGARIELDLSHLKEHKSSYSLFPGQIVAVEGLNSLGHKMTGHRICEGAAPAPIQTPVKELLHYHHDLQQGQPLKIVTVAGPFTTSDNLDYEPLVDLLNAVKIKKPDVVILTGPFVDMNHQAVKSGRTTLQDEDGEEIIVPFETFFAHKVAGLLEDLFADDSSLTTQFVLVPSLDDAAAERVYPQPPMKDRIPTPDGRGQPANVPGGDGIDLGTLGLHGLESEDAGARHVHCVSNPCTLKINELTIGVTSTDVLFHMSADETNANLDRGSRLARISQHLVQQGNYYPLFPPAPGVNLDLKYQNLWKMPCQPDLLVIPSKLACFAKPVLDSTLIVNPGRLTRDTTGGTYASITVHPIKRETLEDAGGDDVELHHSVQERTEVQIKKI